MPIAISEALDDQGAAAVTKAAAVKDLPRYLGLAAAAGAFVGLGITLLVSVSAPLAASGNAATKLVQAAVFGLALTLVVFAGAELFTGNAMTMLQGLRQRLVRPGQLAAVWAASLVGNLVGSIALAAAVNAGGTLDGPGSDLVASMVRAKDALTGGQLFWRAVLCNLLVCLALWMAARTRSDGAKLALLWWALLAFIGSSFEHSIANMTVFALGVFQGSATWDQLLHNLAWTVPGNVVGGGLLVGLGYAWVGRSRRVAIPEAPAGEGTTTSADAGPPGAERPAAPRPTPVPVGAGTSTGGALVGTAHPMTATRTDGGAGGARRPTGA